MRPAPIDSGVAYCSLDCKSTSVYAGEWTSDGMYSASFCSKCGRALGFDADGNPVVGYSAAHLERAALLIAENESCRHRHRPAEFPESTGSVVSAGWYLLSPAEVLQEALAATEDAADFL